MQFNPEYFEQGYDADDLDFEDIPEPTEEEFAEWEIRNNEKRQRAQEY